MADNHTPEERSRNMAAIRSKDTEPEVYLRKKLFAKGYRYRKYKKNIPGHPDLFLAKYNTVIFINGCFWHRHQNCRYAYMPKSRAEFWENKFSRNTERDRKVKEDLQCKGIRCLIVWECTIRKMKKSSITEGEVIAQIEAFLKSEEVYMEI